MKAAIVCRTPVFALAALVALVIVLPSSAQVAPEPAPELDYVPGELIVLLDHGPDVPSAEEVVAAHRRGNPIPGGLGIGNPHGVELAIRNRASRAEQRLAEIDPDHPAARAQRYLLLKYHAVVDLDRIADALARNPNVVHVEKNIVFQLSATPNDPFFAITTDPMSSQWGSHFMNLPAAWDFAKGHANVGLIDLGIDIDHPDLQAFDGSGSYVGGNFRPHLSHDFAQNDTCVDELNACPGFTSGGTFAGHGTHVSGIVAGTANNGVGVAGACWGCSILMGRVTSAVHLDDAANALDFLVEHGAQMVSMSWGYAGSVCGGAAGNLGLFCNQLELADRRDVVMTASPGNDKLDIEFPASDSRVLSIGGIEPDGAFWDRADEGEGCPCDWSNKPQWLVNACATNPTTFECGSNYTVTPGSAEQDLVAPAKHVVSTFYPNATWNPSFGCNDDVGGPFDGYGPCTGTSMSSPYVAAVAGILRSVNPLLSKSDIRNALISNASRAGNWHPQLGYGVPNAAASVQAVLGRVGGNVLDNRLTPLFSMYSPLAEDHLFTVVPQVGAAAHWASSWYVPIGPDVAGYGYFPDSGCQVSPCSPEPGASVFIFSTDRSPNGHPLVPLYRLSYEAPDPTPSTPQNENPDLNQDHNYTTEPAGIEALAGAGYRLDGIEGYIYRRCTPEPSCIPTGAVRLYRYYNATRDDWAIFPESEVAQWQAAGYAAQSGFNPWIGYVYENVDTDGDWAIDGFEVLIGTNPSVADSDGDGLTDGQEILEFPYSDPLSFPLSIFDGFAGGGALHARITETGGVSWAAQPAAQTTGGRVVDRAAIGGVPLDPTLFSGAPTLAVTGRVDPSFSDWVGLGFSNQAATPYWSAGQLWALLRSGGTYEIYSNGTSHPLGSGSIPGTPVGGYHQVEVRYDSATNSASVLINGVQVLSGQPLAFTPSMQFAGFQMYKSGTGRLDDFEVRRVSSPAAVLIADSFAGSGALDGRSAEVGGVTWSARAGASLVEGHVVDDGAIGGVPVDPSALGEFPVLRVSADADPTLTDWVGAGFADRATTPYWAAGELWVLVRSTGSFEVHALGSNVATGSIPGTPTNGFHHLDVRYDTTSGQARVSINGIQVFSGVLASVPDIQFAGFHMHRAAEGGGKLDNFQVISTATP